MRLNAIQVLYDGEKPIAQTGDTIKIYFNNGGKAIGRFFSLEDKVMFLTVLCLAEIYCNDKEGWEGQLVKINKDDIISVEKIEIKL